MKVLKMARLDFFSIKSQLLLGGLSFVWIIFFFRSASLLVLFFTCAWFMSMHSTAIFAIEEKNGLRRLYGTLSLATKDIVLGRYLFILLNFLAAAAGLALVSSITPLRSLLKMAPLNGVSGFCDFSCGLLIFIAIIGIQAPAFFKLGYTKARFWSMAPFMLGLLPFLLTKIGGFTVDFSRIMAFIAEQQLLTALGAQAVGFTLLVISYRLSLAWYHPRR